MECKKVEVITARGSGDEGGKANDDETDRYYKNIVNSLPSSNIGIQQYILGTESYGNHQYPHVDVTNLLVAAGAIVSGGSAFKYGNSVDEGVKELVAYLSQHYVKCQSVGTYYILGGYSQGAQVVGEALWQTPSYIRDRIVFVGLFGDPTNYFPEGKTTGTWPFTHHTPACNGESLSLYRRKVARCDLEGGSLGARMPNYLPHDMHTKTGVWCIADDFICRSSRNIFNNGGHERYKAAGSSIDSAAEEAAARLQHVLEREPRPQPTPSPETPDPEPAPQPDQLIDITHRYGMGINGQDVVFLVDRSYDMKLNFPQIQQYLERTLAKIEAAGNHFTVFYYASSPFGYTSSMQPVLYGQPFGYMNVDTTMQIYNQLLHTDNSTLSIFHRGSVIDALSDTMDAIHNWHNGANKSIIVLSNSPSLTGDITETKSTLAKIARQALLIDPVNIYPIVPQEYASVYEPLASLTSGAVIPYTDNLEEAADTAYHKIHHRPAAFLKFLEYIANPGQTITFDASDSYTVEGTIVKYDWDFDGDNVFDRTTTAPITTYAYIEKGDGVMQVRITTSDGSVANASATLKIGTYVPPMLPKTPQNLQTTVIETKDNTSTVRLTWDKIDDSRTFALSLSVNGIILGMMQSDRTTVDVTDIDRTIDVDFGISAMDQTGTLGNPAITTLARLQPFTPSSVTLNSQIVDPYRSAPQVTPSVPVTSNNANVLGLRTNRVGTHAPIKTFANTAKSSDSENATSSNLHLYWLLILVIVGSIFAWRMRHRARSN